MSKIALGLKIDLSKMDMNRIFQGKNGAQYLDATIFVELDHLDQYGNSGMITQDVTKEEKAQKVQGAILGNGNVFWVENGQAPQQLNNQAQSGFQQQAPQQQAPVNQFNGQQPQPQQQGGFSSQTPQQQQQPYQQPQQQSGSQQQVQQQQGGYQQPGR